MQGLQETNDGKGKTVIEDITREWKVQKLSDVCILVKDGSHYSPTHQIRGYPLATVANMRDNRIDIASCYRISRQDYDMLIKNHCDVNIGDILFSKDGTVGLCMVYEQKDSLVVLSSVAIIRPDISKLNPYFLKYTLQSTHILNKISGVKTGTALKRIILKDLRKVNIPLPSLAEQKKIASILSKVDELIQKTDQIIEQTQRLKKGLMQKLLIKGLGHTRFKKTEVGQIPQEWQVTSMQHIVESYKNGIYKRPEYYGRGLPSIRMFNIKGGRIDSIDAPLLEVTKQESKDYELTLGDILVNRVNSKELVGKAGIVAEGLGQVLIIAFTKSNKIITLIATYITNNFTL